MNQGLLLKTWDGVKEMAYWWVGAQGTWIKLERVEDVEKEKASFVLRPPHNNAASIQNLDPALNDLYAFVEDQQFKFSPVPRNTDGRDFQLPVPRERNRTGLLDLQAHAFLGE